TGILEVGAMLVTVTMVFPGMKYLGTEATGLWVSLLVLGTLTVAWVYPLRVPRGLRPLSFSAVSLISFLFSGLAAVGKPFTSFASSRIFCISSALVSALTSSAP